MKAKTKAAPSVFPCINAPCPDPTGNGHCVAARKTLWHLEWAKKIRRRKSEHTGAPNLVWSKTEGTGREKHLRWRKMV